MIIIEQDVQWQQTLWLLSLDDIVGLAGDLWLPVDARALAASLRKVLERHLAQPDAYLEHPSRATYELFRHLEQTRGSRDLEQLIAWGRSVGIGGTRRADQGPWQYVLGLIRARRPGTEQLEPWIGALSQRVREAELRLEARIDPRVHAQFASERSDWDRRAADLHAHDRDWIAEWARGVIGGNIFAFVWQEAAASCSFAELERLHEATRGIAAAHHMDREGWAFPGSWSFALAPFLEGARSVWT